jgi:hypothetical protein
VPLSVPKVSVPGPTPRAATAASTTVSASLARQRTSIAEPTICRAAVDDRVEIDPAVLGDPDRGHVHVPELVGAGDLEVARPPTAALRALGLQELVLAHQPLHPLAMMSCLSLKP